MQGIENFNSVREGRDGGLHQSFAQTGDFWICLLHHHCKLGLFIVDLSEMGMEPGLC